MFWWFGSLAFRASLQPGQASAIVAAASRSTAGIIAHKPRRKIRMCMRFSPIGENLMHMRILRRGLWAMMPAVLLLAAATIAEACPGCKEALNANDPNHQNIVRGYFWSILFMMGMPYVTLVSFGGYL